MKDQHEASRAAFEALYRHPNTYDASQNVRDHIRQTNEIAWQAWCRAIDYAAEQQTAPTPLTRPDRPGWWWCWEPDRKQWRVGWARMEWPTDEESRSEKQLVWWSPGCGYDADKINVTVLKGSLWLPATPPPAPPE